MKDTRICFIGGGNMARSLIGGLIADGLDPASITAADPDRSQRDALASTCGIATHADNATAAGNADTVVLAVKPQVMRTVATELASALDGRGVLVISIAAGIRSADIDRWLGGGVPIVRAMSNTPALLGSGVSALVANDATTPEQRETAEAILRAVGVAIWFDHEEALDAVTAVSGSGPAYFFLFMELIAAAGEQLGLDPKVARLLTVETALGAARMALESHEALTTLRHHVTSPGGTTAAALAHLDRETLRELVVAAVTAAHERAVGLADEFGSD